MFKARGGMVEAGPTSHFVKPSKQVDSRFLRASNALSEGAEVFFVAFFLLPYLCPGSGTFMWTPPRSQVSLWLAY